MTIQSGSNEVTNIQVGNTPITEVYSGSTKIWPVSKWKTIWENANGLTINPNESTTAISLVTAASTSNKFRITYKYEIYSNANINYDNCFYRNPSQIYFTEETLPPQNTINIIEVERSSSTAKGVNLFLLGAEYTKYSPSTIVFTHSTGIRLHASTTGLLLAYPLANTYGDTSFNYVIKMTFYKIEQYEE